MFIVMNKLFVTLKFEPYTDVFVVLFLSISLNSFLPVLTCTQSHPVTQIMRSCKLGQRGQIKEFFGLFTRASRVFI